MSRLAWQGVALFAFIPLVLFLYLQLPLGPGASLALGATIMLSHRFVAAPWMARHARERCLWCGAAIPTTRPTAASRSSPPSNTSTGTIEIANGARVSILAACSDRHRSLIGSFLTFVSRFRVPIAAGIFVPLLLLLAGTLALAFGRPFISHEVNALQFRTIVALTVAGTSIAYLAVRRPSEPLSCPFPLHNLFLLGIRNTLWVFRLVGVLWLAMGIGAIARFRGV